MHKMSWAFVLREYKPEDADRIKSICEQREDKVMFYAISVGERFLEGVVILTDFYLTHSSEIFGMYDMYWKTSSCDSEQNDWKIVDRLKKNQIYMTNNSCWEKSGSAQQRWIENIRKCEHTKIWCTKWADVKTMALKLCVGYNVMGFSGKQNIDEIYEYIFRKISEKMRHGPVKNYTVLFDMRDIDDCSTYLNVISHVSSGVLYGMSNGQCDKLTTDFVKFVCISKDQPPSPDYHVINV